MIQSIIDDIRLQLRHGNMITRIILINLFIFLGILLVKILTPGNAFETKLVSWLAWPGAFGQLIKQPWSVLTYMFLHEGIWHLAWNMLMFYWFGRIFGDLLGDKRVLPLYILGGLVGGLSYFIFAQFASGNSVALGASAAVMSIIVATAWVAPEYNLRLLLLGDVKLKYIVAFLVILDIFMISEANNTGGRISHLGGALFGAFYIRALNLGVDLTAGLSRMIDSWFHNSSIPRKAPMKVIQLAQRDRPKSSSPDERNLEVLVDSILDKIKDQGYESLTVEEKDILYRASKKS